MGSAKHPAKDRAKRKNVCKECHLKAICFWVIGYILDTTYLLLKLLRFLGFVIGWLNEADLSVFFQKQIVFQTFIPCICGYFFVSGLMVLLQLLQEWNKRAEVCSVRKHFDSGYVFTVYSNLDIIRWFQLSVSHVVILHPHESSIRVSLGVTVTAFSHDFERIGISFPPFA